MIRCCCSTCAGAVVYLTPEVYLAAHPNADGHVAIVLEPEEPVDERAVRCSRRRHPSMGLL